MWLILTAFAAIVTTVIWYVHAPHDKYKLGLLSLIFWGATLMWFIDHLVIYLSEGGAFFEISLDAFFLGISVILLGLLLWIITLLISDPKGVWAKVLRR